MTPAALPGSPRNRGVEECVLLYVEDDDATAYLFRMALRENGISPQFFRVTDGVEGTAFLLRLDGYSDAPRPHLVLLDLNLPRKSGFDVLSEIKSDTSLRDLTVIVFSSSTFPHDRARSMELGANDWRHDELYLISDTCTKMGIFTPSSSSLN